MTPNKPNILFLSIDCLRADRLKALGATRPTTPNIDSFAETSLLCRRVFSLGPFTQSAFVQMMTSSRAFSYGGYDAGAIGRPKTLFKSFQESGYRTTALSTLHWVNSYFGYGDGINDEWQLFTINTVMGVAIANMRSSINSYIDGVITKEQALDVIGEVVPQAFDNIEDYAKRRLITNPVLKSDFPYSQLVRSGFNYRKIIKIIERHRQAFYENPWLYTETHLIPAPEAHTWLAREWRYCRTLRALVGEAYTRTASRIIRPFSREKADNLLYRNRSYVDAESLARKTIQILHDRAKSSNNEQPFFLWCHFMDNHLPYNSGRGLKWYKETPYYLKQVGHDESIEPALTFDRKRLQNSKNLEAAAKLYDAAVHWTDEQIGHILHALKETGLENNTIVAIVGDHGEEFGEHGFIGHYFLGTERNMHVPLIISVPGGKGKTCDHLASLVDVAPTLARCAGVTVPPEWEGVDVESETASRRQHIIAETFFGGNCIFDHRPPYMSVRTHNRKYMWRERRDPRDNYTLDDIALFDLDADPQEENNIYSEDHPEVPHFNRLIAERLAEIPEFSNDRIVACFGKIGEQAIASIRNELKNEAIEC